MARVIVVDDEPAIGGVIGKILTRNGHEVILAGGGLEAIKKLSQGHEPDLMITDIVMPDMNGVKLIDNVRKLYPKIKIVAISGGGPQYGPETCLELATNRGADRILMKPIDMNKLLAVTKELLTPHKAAPSFTPRD